MKAPALSLAAWLGASLLAGACGDDEAVPETPDAAAPQPDAEPAPDALTLTFAARIDGEPFACGQSYAGLGAAGADYVAADFRFYVHDVVVTTAGGDVPVSLDAGPFQDAAGGVALLDFEDASSSCQAGSAATHTAVVGTVPAGTVVTGVRFKVGVPFALNHLDATTAAPPLNVPAMYWAWASGYKFVRIDGVVGGAGFNLHLGTTGCGTTGSTPPTGPCASPNVFEVSLPGFDPAAEIVVADVAPVLADVDLAVNTPSTAPGCMSFPGDPECTTILPKLGLPYGEAPAGDQRLFTAATP